MQLVTKQKTVYLVTKNFSIYFQGMREFNDINVHTEPPLNNPVQQMN